MFTAGGSFSNGLVHCRSVVCDTWLVNVCIERMIATKMSVALLVMSVAICAVSSAAGSVIGMPELCPCRLASECPANDIVPSIVSSQWIF